MICAIKDVCLDDAPYQSVQQQLISDCRITQRCLALSCSVFREGGRAGGIALMAAVFVMRRGTAGGGIVPTSDIWGCGDAWT